MSRLTIDLKAASVEQVAAQLLTIMRENKLRNPPANYYPGSLESILQMEFSPVALGIKVTEDVSKPPWDAFSSYGADSGPGWLRTKFFESVAWLCDMGYIVHEQSLGSDDFAKVTPTGEAVEIDSTTMKLLMSRPWDDWKSAYERSIFLLGIVKDDVVASGTAFMIGPRRFGTCGHNFSGNVVVYIDEDEVEIPSVNKKKHSTADVAVFSLSPVEHAPQVILPLRNNLPGLGEEMGVLGFSPNSRHQRSIRITVGVVAALSRSSNGDLPVIQIDVPVKKGCGGAPVIDQWGRVVGIVNEKPEEARINTDSPQGSVTQVVPVCYLQELL